MPQVAPKPDVNTGEPRPPQAPVITTWENEGRTDRASAKFPPAPEGEGPVLEWYQQTEFGLFKGGCALSFLLVVFLCILDGGFSWMSTW